MKFKILLSIFLLAIAVNSCSNIPFFQVQTTDNFLPLNTIRSGNSLISSEPIRIAVDNSVNEEIDRLEVTLTNETNGEVQTISISNNDTSLNETIELQDLELHTNTYSMDIELFNEQTILGVHNTWFYYTNEEISISYVTIKPHSASVGEPVEITATLSLPESYTREPYAQLRVNNEFVQSTTAINNKVFFEIPNLEKAGVYNITLDIYPWYNDRINQKIESSYQYNMELLVVSSESSNEEREGHILQSSQSLSIEDNLMFYENERINTIITIDSLPNADINERFFAISDERVMLALQNVSNEIQLSLITASGRADRYFPLENRYEQVSISIFETDIHFTILIMSNNRLVWGSIVPYSDFTNNEENALTTGISVLNIPQGNIFISSIQEQESLYKQYASLEFGNFLLYANGFEFENEHVNETEHSENIAQEASFITIPPGEWIQFPAFAIDEQSLVIETQFHPEDSIDTIEVVLQAAHSLESESLDSENSQSRVTEEIFVYSGSGIVHSNEEIQMENINTDHNLNFTLNYLNNQVLLTIQNFELPLSTKMYGNYSFRIRNTENALSPVRLDSISISNKAEEFVDQVLDTLP